MFKVAVWLLALTNVSLQLSGGLSDFQEPTIEESLLLDKVVDSLMKGTSGLEHVKCGLIPLLQDPENVRVASQVVDGTNYFFKITTKDPTTPKIYMKVHQGMPVMPLLKVTHFGPEIPK